MLKVSLGRGLGERGLRAPVGGGRSDAGTPVGGIRPAVAVRVRRPWVGAERRLNAVRDAVAVLVAVAGVALTVGVEIGLVGVCDRVAVVDAPPNAVAIHVAVAVEDREVERISNVPPPIRPGKVKRPRRSQG